MKICYVVYREDNVMVFDSQVLEYLKVMRDKVECIELVIFRHEKNLFHKSELEKKILEYVDECVTFASFPVITGAQLQFNAVRLQKHARNKYMNEQVAVICRGDLAAYVASRAFKCVPGSRILFDNRGLPQEESILSHGDQWLHKRNREVKAFAMNYAKSHCDAYNFVTTNLRKYDIERYGYREDLPYSIIPTLFKNEIVDDNEVERLRREERCGNDDFIVTYIGSTAAWQSTGNLINIIHRIYVEKPTARFFILTNGAIPDIQKLDGELQQRVVIKKVPHNDVKYYLKMTDVGIVIRDNSIVNQVAAPTKIAEYVTSGVQLLYSGNIGILADLSKIKDDNNMIDMDKTDNWENLLKKRSSLANVTEYVDYFDMNKRQLDTLKLFEESFARRKM